MKQAAKQCLYIILKFVNNCKKYVSKKQNNLNFEERSLYSYLRINLKESHIMVSISRVESPVTEDVNVIMQHYIPEIYKKNGYKDLSFILLFEKNIFFKKQLFPKYFDSSEMATRNFVSLFLKIKNIKFQTGEL